MSHSNSRRVIVDPAFKPRIVRQADGSFIAVLDRPPSPKARSSRGQLKEAAAFRAADQIIAFAKRGA